MQENSSAAQNFKNKQQAFYDGCSQNYQQISSQTLHSSFHPITYQQQKYQHQSVTYIVKLDQIMYPESSEIIKMSTSVSNQALSKEQSSNSGLIGRQLDIFSINRKVNDIEEEDEEEEQKEVFFTQSLIKSASTGSTEVQFNMAHQSQKAISRLDMHNKYIIGVNEGDLATTGKLRLIEDKTDEIERGDKNASAQKLQQEKHMDLRQTIAKDRIISSLVQGSKKSAMMSISARPFDQTILQKQGDTQLPSKDENSSQLMDDPLPLHQQSITFDQQSKNYYELSIWACEYGKKSDQCMAVQRFSLSNSQSFLRDSFQFSVDGCYLYLIIVDNSNQLLTDFLIFNSVDLSPLQPHSLINIRRSQIYAPQIEMQPQLIPSTQTTPMILFIEAGKTIHMIQDKGDSMMQLEEELGKIQGESECWIRHIIFKRIAQESTKALIHVLLIVENMKESSKYQLKAYHLKLDDFLKLNQQEKQIMNYLKLKALSKANIALFEKKDFSSLVLKSHWEHDSHYIMLSLQPNLELGLNNLPEVKDTANIIFVSMNDKTKQYHAQLSTDYYRSQYLHFCSDPVLIVFNEKLNTHIGLTMEIMLSLVSKKNFVQNQFIEYFDLSHIDTSQLIKIKAEEKLQVNCFDVIFYPKKRDYTLLNCYFVDDKKMLFLQNHKGSKHFLNFLKFVEMFKGSLTLANSHGQMKDFYRHRTLFFLTKVQEWSLNEDLDSAGLAKIHLYCIEMPKYAQLNDCILGNLLTTKPQVGIPKAEQYQNYLVIQTSKQIIVQPLCNDAQAQVKSYPFGNNQEVPICISKLNKGEVNQKGSLSLIYLYCQDSKQELRMLNIFAKNKAEVQNLCKLPSAKYLQITCNPEQVLLFEISCPSVTQFIYQARTQTLKEEKIYDFVDELKQLLENYYQTQVHFKTVISQEGLYIGPSYFQYLNRESADFEEIEDFEVQRAKEVANVKNESLLSGGPILSSDGSRIIFLLTSLGQSRKDFGFNQDSLQQVPRQSEISGNVSMLFSKTKTLSKDFQQTFTQNSLGEKQFEFSQTEAQLNKKIIEENEKQFEQRNYHQYQNTIAYELPLFQRKEFHFLPQDEYLSKSLKFSTFVIEDLILVHLNQTFMLFTKYGKSTPISIDPKILQLFKSKSDIKLVQVKAINKDAATALLMEDDNRYYVLIFENKQFKMQLSLEESKCQDKVSYQNSLLLYRDARLDIFGSLYQILIKQGESKQLEVQIYINNQLRGNISTAICQKLRADINNNKVDIEENGHGHGFHQHHEDLEHEKNREGANISDINKRLIEKNQVVHDHSSQNYIFEIIHDQYLVIKSYKTIWFVDFRKTQNLEVNKIDILLEGEIVSLHQTQANYFLQFVYRVRDKQDQSTYIFTWDLNINSEYSMQKIKNNRHSKKMYKCIEEQLNFYIPNDKEFIYDIRYEFPINYFSGAIANQSQIYRDADEIQVNNCQEYKVCSQHQSLLGISIDKLASVQLSYSILNLQYVEFLSEKLKQVKEALDYESPPAAIYSLLRFSIEGNNPLHYFALDQNFLQQYIDMIKEKIASGESRLGSNMVSYALLLNSNQISPFQITNESKTLKSIELILEILCLNSYSGIDYFRHMKKYFIQLIETKSQVFFKFFDQCCTEKEEFRLQTVKYDFRVKPINVTHNSRILNRQFFLHKLSAEEEKKLGFSNLDSTFTGINNGRSLADQDPFKDPVHLEAKKNLAYDVQPVHATIFDYGWLLRGQAGQEFVDYLAQQNADSHIFKLKNIHTIINAQWKPFRKLYIKWMFIPFCIYFVAIICFNSIMNEHIFSLERLMEYETNPGSNYLNHIRMPAGIIMVILGVYFLLLEFLKMKFVNFRTATDYSVYLMVLFHVLILTTFAANFLEGKQVADEEFFNSLDPYIILSSISVMCAYFVLLVHLKIFGPFAFYINLIFVCLRDSFTYNIILSIGGLAFANTMFILAMIEKPDTSYDKITGVNLFTGILYQVKGYLYLEVEGVKMKNKYVFGIIYAIYTLIITQIMLKVLINLLHHLYEQAQETYHAERLRTTCILIRENELYFGREQMFKKVKYIIRFYAEVAKSYLESGGGHGKHGGGQVQHDAGAGEVHQNVSRSKHQGNDHSRRYTRHHEDSTNDNHDEEHEKTGSHQIKQSKGAENHKHD